MPIHDEEIPDQVRERFASDEEDSFGVGYKRPPRSRAFKKGLSGNPKGRPKGRRNMPDMLKGLLNASVPVRLGGKTRHMSKAEAMFRVQVMKARQGDVQALNTIVSTLDLAGHLDELSDDERNKYGVIQVPPKLPDDEWDLLFGPDFEHQRQKYLAMPDLVDPDYVPTSSDLKRDTFINKITVGDALRTKGDLDGALAVYRECLNIIHEFTAMEPDNPQWWWGGGCGLQRVGDVLKIQGNLRDALPAFRGSLDLMRKVAVASPDFLQPGTDIVLSLCKLASVGDDPHGRLNEALEILKPLSEQCRLTLQQKGWIGEIEQDLATLALTGSLNQSNKPRVRVTRPVLANLSSASSKAGGSNEDAIGDQSQNPGPLREAVIVPEMNKSLEQWKKGGHRAGVRGDERLMGNKELRPKAIHRKVGYNLGD